MTGSADLDTLITTENEWPIKEVGGLTLVFSPLLNQYENLKHAFTTRKGGQSPEPLDSFNLGRHMTSDASRLDAMKNRKRLCQALGLNFEALVVPGQVHSKNVVLTNKGTGLAEVDGVIVSEKKVPALLHFADCVPIVIFAPKQNVVSVVHAGWRGTAARIAIEAIGLMQSRCHCQPADLVVAIGPAIGTCCYPTGEDTAQKLMASLHSSQADSHLVAHMFKNENCECRPNLKAINAFQLAKAGITKIDIANACTSCQAELFYSHRRTQGKTGRQGVVACLV